MDETYYYRTTTTDVAKLQDAYARDNMGYDRFREDAL